MVLTNVCWLGLLRDIPREVHQSYATSIAPSTGVINPFLNKLYILSKHIFLRYFANINVVLNVTTSNFQRMIAKNSANTLSVCLLNVVINAYAA